MAGGQCKSTMSEARTVIFALESVVGKPLYLELPGVGHDSWTAVFERDSEVRAWMFRQKRHSSSASTCDP